MQGLDDDEKREVLGEVLADELRSIREYVEDVPKVKEEVHQVHAKVDDIDDRLRVIEAVVKHQETDIRKLKNKAA